MSCLSRLSGLAGPACDALAPPSFFPGGLVVIVIALVVIAAAVLIALGKHRK